MIDAPSTSPDVERDAGRGSTTRPARTFTRRCDECRHQDWSPVDGLLCGITLPGFANTDADDPARRVAPDDSCDLWDSAL